MAAKSRLELILELKDKLFNNKLAQSKAKFNEAKDKMMGKVKQLKLEHAKAFTAMKDNIPGLSRLVEFATNKYVLMVGAVLGIGMAMNRVSREAAGFNHEFLQIENLNLDKSSGTLKSYKQLIADTAFAAGTDLKKTTIAFYDVQSALGIFGNEAALVTKKVADFSVATGADLNDSINSTTKAMKAFGLGAGDVDMLLASNAKTVQVGITNFKELAQVQTEYAGAAKGSGQTVDTANKIFAAFTSIAKDSRTAATMTKTAFEGLTQAATVKGLKEVGISLYDQNGQMRDLSEVLGEVAGKFKDMTPKEIDELINKIGGPEGLRNLFVKLKTGSEDFFNTLNAFDSSSFDLDKALDNAKGDVTIMAEIIRNRWNTALAELGQVFLPLVENGLRAVGAFVEWFRGKIPAIVSWLKVLGNTILAVGTAFGIIKAPYLIFSAIVIAKNFLMGLSFKALGVAIMNVPLIGWILAAISAFVILYQKSDGFRAIIDGILELVKEFLPLMQAIGLAMMNPLDPTGWANVVSAYKNMDLGGAFERGRQNSLAESKRKREEEEAAQKGFGLGVDDPLNEDFGLGGTGGNSGSTASDISSVTGQGSTQTKNITINIDALVKGGINTEGTVMHGMNATEIERFITDLLMKVTRNAELSL